MQFELEFLQGLCVKRLGPYLIGIWKTEPLGDPRPLMVHLQNEL